MPQQINLCTSVLTSSKQYFPANTMVRALAFVLVTGGVAMAGWLWDLQRASAMLQVTMAEQAREVEGLKLAIQTSRASAAPVDQALTQQLENQRALLGQRQRLLEALQAGVLVPGMGHSDRLQLLARSIPDSVWVTQVQATATSFQVAGFTLEPSALNEWVGRLSASPLMAGLKLSTVQVENTMTDTARKPVKSASEAATPSKPTWAFNLVSAAVPPAPVAKGAQP